MIKRYSLFIVILIVNLQHGYCGELLPIPDVTEVPQNKNVKKDHSDYYKQFKREIRIYDIDELLQLKNIFTINYINTDDHAKIEFYADLIKFIDDELYNKLRKVDTENLDILKTQFEYELDDLELLEEKRNYYKIIKEINIIQKERSR